MLTRIWGSDTKGILCLIAVVALICNFFAWLSWDETFIMKDSIQSISTAKNWLLDQGLSTNILIYGPHFQGVLPAPQTVWPPGVSFLLIIASFTGLSFATLALLLNLFFSAMSGVLVYAILRRCTVGHLFALCSAALFYFTSSSWHLAVELVSEPLFTFVLLAAIYFIPHGLQRHPSAWLLTGFFIAVSITVRYSGIFMATAFALGVLFIISCGSQSIGEKIKQLFMLMLLPGLTFIALQIRTFLLVGSIERNTGVGYSISFFETVQKLAEETSVLMGFRDGMLLTGDIDTYLWLFFMSVVISLCVVSAGLLLRHERHQNKVLNTQWTERGFDNNYIATTASVVLMHTFLFGGFLMYCSIGSSPLRVTSRYLYQLYPGLFIIVCLLLWYLVKRTQATESPRYKTVKQLCLGYLVVMYLVAQVNMVPVLKVFTSRSAEVKEVLQLPVTDKANLADIVRSCVGIGESNADTPVSSVWTNEGAYVHLYTGVNTIALTEVYTTSSFDFDKLKSQINDYGIRLFVFVNNASAKQSGYGDMLSSIKHWLSANQYAKLQLRESTGPSGASVDVFAVDYSCIETLTAAN